MAVLQSEQRHEPLAYFDGALSEQCNQYQECSDSEPCLSAGKPVINAEYRRSTPSSVVSAPSP